MKNTMGNSLPDAIIDEALSNLEITTDSADESIYIFAKRAESLGYLGRDKISLDGLFFDITSNESLMESN